MHFPVTGNAPQPSDRRSVAICEALCLGVEWLLVAADDIHP